MTQEQVLQAILSAYTREQVADAIRLKHEWLESHPDDEAIYEASESLHLMAEAYARVNAQSNPTFPDDNTTP